MEDLRQPFDDIEAHDKPSAEISKETDPLADENLQEDSKERQGDNLW